MRISRIVYVAFLLMIAAPMWAQQSGKDVVVDLEDMTEKDFAKERRKALKEERKNAKKN